MEDVIHDVRRFISILREHGALYDITREVDPVHELGRVLRAAELAGRAAFFHSVKGSDMPVFGGALGSPLRIALALRCETQEQVFDRIQDAREHPLKPEQVDHPAPCHEVIRSKVNVGSLPIPVHAPGDGGPFINAGVVLVRDPHEGRHNLSFIRMQVFGSDLVGVNINLWRHTMDFFRAAEARGENLPFAVAIGVDPAILMAAAFRYEGDEYEIAGSLRGAPVPVVPAQTVDILVPALAEIVVEGEVLAGERHTEGPMAEFTGHYSGTTEQPVGRVTAITHRRDPIFQTIAGASHEHLILGNALTREPTLYTVARRVIPGVTAVHLPPYGSGFTALISLRDARAGEAMSVGVAALSSHVNVKVVIVLDDDVDLLDPVDVMWALSTRVRWDRDCTVISGALGNELDLSSDRQGVQAKIVIDATLGPDRAGTHEKVRYPPVDIGRYLSPE